jgi:hypothetical protein
MVYWFKKVLRYSHLLKDILVLDCD